MLKEFIINEYIFFGILILTIILFRKRITGFFGELWVKIELNKLNKDYKVLNNVIIRTDDNITHQIDHVIVSKYGIFVIETKQINGYIKGNDYDKNWTIKVGRNTYYINNPIHQNYGHIKSLSKVLNISIDKFISLVCISSNAKVRVNSNNVVILYNLIKRIKSYKEEILLNYEEVYSTLVSRNISNYSNSKMHVKNIKENNKCPLCNGQLVNKHGRYGNFIGCSNYPKCKFTK